VVLLLLLLLLLLLVVAVVLKEPAGFEAIMAACLPMISSFSPSPPSSFRPLLLFPSSRLVMKEILLNDADADD